MTVLEVRDLSCRFGSVQAVSNVSFRISTPERLALIGGSGAGKSTLLRSISGLQTDHQGSVWIDEDNVTAQPAHLRNLAFVSQDYALYPQLTVAKNIQTALMSLRLGKEESRGRTSEALAACGIADLQNRLPSELSGGQAQRVALARAIAKQPKLLLLDEPFSQLDCLLKNELRELIEHIVDRFSILLIFVSHDPLDAMRLATRIAVMHQGNLEQLGPSTQLYRSPASPLVAELLSPLGVNWLDASDLNANSGSHLERECHAWLAAGRKLGFRPEAAQLSPWNPGEPADRDVSDQLSVPARIVQDQLLGFSRMVSVATASNHRLRCLVAIEAELTSSASPVKLIIRESDLLRH